MNAQAKIEARTGATVSAADLRDACVLLRMAVARKSKVPVLTMVRVATDAKGLVMTATDLDVELSVLLPSDAVEAKGAVMIPMHRLEAVQKAASVLGEAQIVITWSDSTIFLSAGAAQARVQTVCSVSDFPAFASKGFMPHGTLIERGDMRRLLALSMPCVSTEETRYYLNGVALQAHEGHLRAIATDGHRMAVIDAPAIDWSAGNMILPTGAAKLVMAILASRLTRDAYVAVDIHDAPKVRLTVGKITLSAKLIDGTFPNYARVIPERGEGWDTIDISVSHMQVRTLAAIAMPIQAPHVIRCVALDANAGFMWVREADDAARFPIMGTGFTAFNLRYVQAMTALNPVARFRSKRSGDPAIVTGEDPDAFWVVMPMRADSVGYAKVAEGWL